MLTKPPEGLEGLQNDTAELALQGAVTSDHQDGGESGGSHANCWFENTPLNSDPETRKPPTTLLDSPKLVTSRVCCCKKMLPMTTFASRERAKVKPRWPEFHQIPESHGRASGGWDPRSTQNQAAKEAAK